MLFCCINQHPNQPGNVRCDTCSSLLAGAQISEYRVISYIGKGSTSDVYLAEQQSLHGRKVVLKMLHRSCSEEYVDSFRSEAKLLASLSHPYILPIFSYGVIHEATMFTESYIPYLVIQFVEQGSLADSFEREGNRPWSLERVVTLAQDVAEALDYAHSRNVIHRDVKPANLLQIGTHVLLSDFSVASLIDANASHLSISLAGSPAYMAPEVWRMHPGRYSDQYALAITCYFLLTGKYPLTLNGNSNMRGWQHAHCFTTPTSLREYRADLPLVVDVVLQKAMAKNPHERYPTVEAFAVDLLQASQDITQQLEGSSNPVARFRPLSENVRVNEKAFVKFQPIGLSVVNTPATEPIAIPDISAPPKHRIRDHEGMNKTLLHEVHIASPKTRSRSNRWIWCALTLNIFIFVLLIIEYTLLIGKPVFSIRLLLTVCPALLLGVLLALLFKRIALTTLSLSLLWGMLFGTMNAFLSTIACMVWYSLVLVVPFGGTTGEGLSSFFDPTLHFFSDSRIVILLLIALWVSVIGGAIIGIMNIQGEGEMRIIHPKRQK
ncbi:MAG: serine/threonine protein kinase [Ktedonobacteraceae bacterium]